MDIIALEILLIACLTSIVCALPGVFLVLRGVALMSDAISHAILLGIAVMFLLLHDLHSPLLIVGAVCTGILTVMATEFLIATQCLKKDAAIGLVFPLFFSIGVLLISRYARDVHLDIDMVLLGEIAFAPFNRLYIGNVDIGPYALWVLLGALSINVLFVMFFFKELVLAIFDEQAAFLAGFKPRLLYYGLMLITSISAVVAFDIVGSVVVVALMITPAATAFLLSATVQQMINIALMTGVLSSIIGYTAAHFFDVSIAGSIATTTGMVFLIALLMCAIKSK